MKEPTWIPALCPICGRPYKYLKTYKPATCGDFFCAQKAYRLGILSGDHITDKDRLIIGRVIKEI